MIHFLYQIGKFILTVKRIVEESYFKTDIDLLSNNIVFVFNSFDEFYDFSSSLIKKNTYHFFKKASLYLYKSKYYLCLNLNNINKDLFKPIYYYMLEFALKIDSPDLFERRIKEYGILVFKTDAVNNCLKYFK